MGQATLYNIDILALLIRKKGSNLDTGCSKKTVGSSSRVSYAVSGFGSVYSGKFMRRSRSAKRGSLCKGLKAEKCLNQGTYGW